MAIAQESKFHSERIRVSFEDCSCSETLSLRQKLSIYNMLVMYVHSCRRRIIILGLTHYLSNIRLKLYSYTPVEVVAVLHHFVALQNSLQNFFNTVQ